jgi:hypothetical protein
MISPLILMLILTTIRLVLYGGMARACACRDGYYVGAGVGVAFLDISGDDDVDENTTHFEWRVLGGVNFAESWYGEVAYNSPGSISGFGIENVALTLGYRW